MFNYFKLLPIKIASRNFQLDLYVIELERNKNNLQLAADIKNKIQQYVNTNPIDISVYQNLQQMGIDFSKTPKLKNTQPAPWLNKPRLDARPDEPADNDEFRYIDYTGMPASAIRAYEAKYNKGRGQAYRYKPKSIKEIPEIVDKGTPQQRFKLNEFIQQFNTLSQSEDSSSQKNLLLIQIQDFFESK